jgi:hypothetical protein
MAWNRIALFEEDGAEISLQVQEIAPAQNAGGPAGIRSWEDSKKYTSSASSDRNDYIWVLSGAKSRRQS